MFYIAGILFSKDREMNGEIPISQLKILSQELEANKTHHEEMPVVSLAGS